MRKLLGDGDTFTHQGYTFRVHFERDEDMQEPWKEHDGHGVVSEWTTREKAPGERVLASDHGSHRYYDIAATLKIAKRDGWGVRRPGTTGKHPDDYTPLPGETKRAQLARAVEADFDHLRAWCNDEWEWTAVDVIMLDEDGKNTIQRESLSGIDPDDEYLTTVVYELADEILHRVEVDEPNVQLSEN